ncbi:bcl-2-binding component 3 [Fukomys damarensis]|uniref:bcl-2-binding component 3 n=1 Tax=Fukomys damarensis TaxID=885580 RepID=UPI0008FF589A|nr:bcl-2-binding component 3 [Fukomys damarensis]
MWGFVTRRGVCAPGSAMARARQEGSSPEPVDGPRPFPLGRLVPSRQEEQQRHRPSPWRVLYNLIMGLLPLPRGHRAPEMEPN